MRITAPASGIKVAWTACGSRTLPTCGARKIRATCAPCAMRAHAKSWIRTGEQQCIDLVITVLDMAPTTRGGILSGVVCMLIGERSSPPRSWLPTSAPTKGPCRWGRPECAGLTPWSNPFGPPSQSSTTTGVPSPPLNRSTVGSPPGSRTSTTADASTPASAVNPRSNWN